MKKKIRVIDTQSITDVVSNLVIKAAVELRVDVRQAFERAIAAEKTQGARNILKLLLGNAKIARRARLPLCQDTGMTVVLCEIGRNVVVDGNIEKAINRGVMLGTKRGYLRRSIVADPLDRINTNTNTPVVVHYSFRPGVRVKLSVLLKGFGSENKGQTVMMNPTVSRETIKTEILRIVKEAGPDACPPYIVGVGIGGTLDKAVQLSKEVFFDRLGKRNPNPSWGSLEEEILKESFDLNIGPLGFGGRTTILDVKIKTFPTHIAGLPLAVNVGCHSLRTASELL